MMMVRRMLAAVAGLALVVTATVVVPSATGAQEPDPVVPMIFVHGGFGSGQQFEAQALRFASNGFPEDHIEMFEHNSLAYPGSQLEVWERLERQIDDLLAATGADAVNLLGHSQGTGLVQGYLNSSPERAEDVARYVNLDGGSGGTVPDEIEVLAIWGEGNPAREVPGATNVYLPEQGHTEVVNSPETFVEIYRFFLGEDPTFDEVVRQPADEVVVGGRVQLFPQNDGATDATLEIYEVEAETGARLAGAPVATFALAGDGSWGPFDADGEAFYEFAIVRPTGTHHIYVQRFVRSNPWVRILTSEPGGLADSFWENGDDHANVVVMRNTEWWGDQGNGSDRLVINGEDVVTPAISPRSNRTIGIFVHDEGVDGQSNLDEPVAPSGIAFLTGADLFIRASDPPDNVVSVVASPRRGVGDEAVCTPNRASSVGRISIQFLSFHQLLDPDGSLAGGHANPTCARVADPAPTPVDPTPIDRAPPAQPVPATPTFTG